MKKFLSIVLVLCSMNFNNAFAAAINPTDVVSTIKPVHALVAGVLGDEGENHLLVGGAQTLHGYIMKPSDISALNNARIVFYIDNCLETFIEHSAENASAETKFVALSSADGVKIMNRREGAIWEKHEHHHEEHAHEHEEHDEHEDHKEHACKIDGHMWLAPENAIAFTKKIAEELAKAYPLYQQKFFANAEKQIKLIQENDKRISDDFAKLNKKPFIVFHDAYQYFEAHYGLVSSGSITIDPSIPPGALRIKQIKDKISKLGIRCVFKEPVFDAKLTALVTEGKKVKMITLDPEGAGFQPSKNLYIDILNNISSGLQECFS